MASPRVFISSTCYDLADERDALSSFCDGFGFGCALSERGDIFYHPDLHTHVSCVREVSTCQLFVLIIGGRFGGKYISDKSKSITNAEYAAARELGIPVFTFVRQDVLNDHNIWQRNREQPFAMQIVYPSVDKQEHALDIFGFVDQVRLAPTNNGVFGFRLSREIFETLRKQWSSMLFEYLQSRSLARQLATTNENIASLTAASAKIEEIVRSIYKNVDSVGADESLTAIDLDSKAKELFLTIAAKCQDRQFLYSVMADEMTSKPPVEWFNFLANFGFFDIVTTPSDTGKSSIVLQYDILDIPVAKIGGDLNKLQKAEVSFFAEGYEAYLKLAPEARRKIVSDYLYITDKESAKRPD